MDIFVKERIIEWALAHKAAEGNADLLLTDHMRYGDECASRMKTLQYAEDDMLALAGRAGLPPALVRYIKATEDIGCAQCRYSSALPKHPECDAKIHEYFTAREVLTEFGLSL